MKLVAVLMQKREISLLRNGKIIHLVVAGIHVSTSGDELATLILRTVFQFDILVEIITK